ncbi:hypothetical protein [Pantanalinema sp. GBBB05]|uniref:hypothetical protein n=1 Tax=Pantanalinema sp. GBBB05 TaxID=2604139 RepID=UPI001DA057AB|nr:hypothetical protein [Pantanalinema sp. GBBB05]
MIDTFIADELAVAPNPLGTLFNLKLATIPIDAYTCFELWVPPANGILLPEEAMLLRGDRLRLEDICARLVWLLGATLIADETLLNAKPEYDWRILLKQMAQLKAQFDAIGVDYFPQTICPSYANDGIPNAWTIRPATWHVKFLALQPAASGYCAKPLALKLSLSLGQLITRRSHTPPVGASL